MLRLAHTKLAATVSIAFVLAGAPLRSRATKIGPALSTPSPRAPGTVAVTREANPNTSIERKFAAPIAENLSRVPDPPIMHRRGGDAFRDRVVRLDRKSVV